MQTHLHCIVSQCIGPNSGLKHSALGHTALHPVHWVKGTGGDQGTQASPSTGLDTSPASACSSSSHTPVWSSKYFGSNVQIQPLLSREILQFDAQNPISHPPALFLILENVQDLHT